jgi:hypothetical protein
MDGDTPRVQAVGAAFVRTLPVAPLWGLRLVAQGWAPDLVSPWTLLCDFALVAGHIWAVIPVAQYQGEEFASKRKLSSIFFLPIIWALFFAGRDLYFALTARTL